LPKVGVRPVAAPATRAASRTASRSRGPARRQGDAPQTSLGHNFQSAALEPTAFDRIDAIDSATAFAAGFVVDAGSVDANAAWNLRRNRSGRIAPIAGLNRQSDPASGSGGGLLMRVDASGQVYKKACRP